jgi:hypothetical protein
MKAIEINVHRDTESELYFCFLKLDTLGGMLIGKGPTVEIAVLEAITIALLEATK